MNYPISNPPIRILLVDDNPDQALIINSLLATITALQFTLDHVTTAAAAQAILTHNQYDLILMDDWLGSRQPRGVAVIRTLLAAGVTVPMIVLTADEDPVVEETALHAGAVDFLTKGELTPRLLGRAIRYAIARAQAEAAVHAERAVLERRVAERTAELSVANAELARAARMKDEFLANMSHELRTPLTAVLGMAEALQEQIYGPLAARQIEAVRAIEQSGRHLLAVINDILDLTKIDAGKVELDLGPVGVAALCQASVQMINQAAVRRQLTVNCTIDPAATLFVADARRVKQTLINLLSNAVKFTPRGGAIGLEVVGDVAQRKIRFTVWDTGIGISAQDRPRLFQPFVQLDSGLARQYEGCGLGLALVARIAELHGASVTVESEPGRGSRFTLTFPWYLSPADAPSAAPAPADLALALPIQRVLIVDDSPTAASVLSYHLNSLGMTTAIHPRGADVLDIVLEAPPDAIMLDILLPDVSGWEVLARLQADPRTRSIPVLIVSVTDERAQGLRLGARDCLVKPVSRAQLAQVLQTLAASTPYREQRALSIRAAGTPDSLRILLAEDNEANSAMLAHYLQARGYAVDVVREGSAVIAQASARRPDLILMDIQMPGMDGLEAIRRIRTDAALGEVPVVALTALALATDRERCLAAGANEYLCKPVKLPELITAIETQAQRRGQDEQDQQDKV